MEGIYSSETSDNISQGGTLHSCWRGNLKSQHLVPNIATYQIVKKQWNGLISQAPKPVRQYVHKLTAV
jgi:hypothetical protein